MATGQDILDRMHLLFPELQTASGGVDVARALIAANMAQDYLESVFALHPEIYGDTTGTVVTVANQESTPFPVGVLRLDGLQLLDPLSARPTAPIAIIRETGGHAGVSSWLLTSGSMSAGCPRQAYTNGRALYWAPYPNQVYTVRWYGLQQAADVTLVDPVAYPDICLTPLANFGIKILRTGLDDDTTAYDTLAKTCFEPVVTALANFRRDRAAPYQYLYSHDT